MHQLIYDGKRLLHHMYPVLNGQAKTIALGIHVALRSQFNPRSDHEGTTGVQGYHVF